MTRVVRVAVKENCYRIIPSRYPTVELFDDVADSDDYENLYQLQSLTNPRLAKPGAGSGSNYINAAFSHKNPCGSRFSDGSFGIYYAGSNLDVAIAETKYHRERFLTDTHEPAQELDMRVLIAHLYARLHNLSNKQKSFPGLYHPSDYRQPQAFGKSLFKDNSDGIRYSSVRHEKHEDCYAVFKSDVLSRCRQSKHLVYSWNGTEIDTIYEKKLLS